MKLILYLTFVYFFYIALLSPSILQDILGVAGMLIVLLNLTYLRHIEIEEAIQDHLLWN